MSYTGETPPSRLHLCGGANPPEPENLPCPRCNSCNTKFCYYNNYNLSQPRHLCKSCRRYWTRGGTLRNVPVGGGSRKNNKRPRTATPASEVVGNKPEATSFCVDVNLKENLHGSGKGFDSFRDRDGFVSGFGELCFGGSGSGDTWQGEQSAFVWPDLAISSLGWGPKEC